MTTIAMSASLCILLQQNSVITWKQTSSGGWFGSWQQWGSPWKKLPGEDSDEPPHQTQVPWAALRDSLRQCLTRPAVLGHHSRMCLCWWEELNLWRSLVICMKRHNFEHLLVSGSYHRLAFCLMFVCGTLPAQPSKQNTHFKYCSQGQT